MIKGRFSSRFSTADKFGLAVELWDELSSNPDEIPVTEEQLNELDRRFEEYRQDPDKVVTWEEAYNWVEKHRRGEFSSIRLFPTFARGP
jgi:putative addiction module component (TIGR02574 family)